MASRGFTLIELLVVLALLGLVLAVVSPLVPNALPGVALKGAAQDVAAGLRYARSLAVTENREVAFILDIEGRRYDIGGEARKHDLPGELALSLFTARSEQVSETTGKIRFFPDGSSTGGRVGLARGQQQYHVTVDWLTGRISIVD